MWVGSMTLECVIYVMWDLKYKVRISVFIIICLGCHLESWVGVIYSWSYSHEIIVHPNIVPHETLFVLALFIGATIHSNIGIDNADIIIKKNCCSYRALSIICIGINSSYFLSFFPRRWDSEGPCWMLNIEWNTPMQRHDVL